MACGTSRAAQDIAVGQLASTTNALTRVLAVEYAQGINLGLQRLNARGGIQGRRVRLVTFDDGFDAARTSEGARTLVERDGVVALIGGLGTQTTMRLITDGFMQRHQIANFAPLTGLAQVLAAPNVFPVRASYDDEVRAMLAHAANLQRRKLAFLYLEAGAGPSMSRQVATWSDTAGVSLIANSGFKAPVSEADTQSIDQALNSLGREAPQAVVLIAVGAPHAAAVKALRQRFGIWLPIYSLGQVNLPDLLKGAGPQAVRGLGLTQVMPSPRSVDLRITRDFSEDRARWAKDLPDSYIALEGYVAARVLCEVLARAKSISREAVLDAALNAGELDVAGFRVQYLARERRSLHPVDVTLVDRDGRLIR